MWLLIAIAGTAFLMGLEYIQTKLEEIRDYHKYDSPEAKQRYREIIFKLTGKYPDHQE